MTCQFAVPPGEVECMEAMWSQGKACKKCSVSCYRQGMSVKEVIADNERLVAEKRETG